MDSLCACHFLDGGEVHMPVNPRKKSVTLVSVSPNIGDMAYVPVCDSQQGVVFGTPSKGGMALVSISHEAIG